MKRVWVFQQGVVNGFHGLAKLCKIGFFFTGKKSTKGFRCSMLRKQVQSLSVAVAYCHHSASRMEVGMAATMDDVMRNRVMMGCCCHDSPGCLKAHQSS